MLLTPLAGGFLAQSRDNGRIDPEALKVVTRRAPSERELADMVFAFRVAKHVKSNAIVYARDGATVGIGAGQMRSEEHTSELQSLMRNSYAVFCLKKKRETKQL